LSVRSFQGPATPHLGLAASLPFRAHSRPRGHLGGERAELVHHRVIVFFSSRISPRTSTVIFWRVPVATAVDVGDGADLAGQVAGHRVDAVGEVLPRPGHALHLGLAAELPFRADLAGHAVTSSEGRSWSTIVLIVASARDLPPHVDVIFLERSPCDRGVT